MLTTKEIKLLRKFIDLTSRTKRVRELSDAKKMLDEINRKHPGAVTYYYGGMPVMVGKDRGTCFFELGKVVFDLMDEADKTEIVGYEVRGTDQRGREISCHYRADSESRLRAQVSRKYGPVEITYLEPMTKEVWQRAYGWGRM